MEQKSDRLYLSTSFENFDLKQRPEKKLNDVNSPINSIKNFKEIITYFKHRNKQIQKEI